MQKARDVHADRLTWMHLRSTYSMACSSTFIQVLATLLKLLQRGGWQPVPSNVSDGVEGGTDNVWDEAGAFVPEETGDVWRIPDEPEVNVCGMAIHDDTFVCVRTARSSVQPMSKAWEIICMGAQQNTLQHLQHRKAMDNACTAANSCPTHHLSSRLPHCEQRNRAHGSAGQRWPPT
jgi:hypothetical protein